MMKAFALICFILAAYLHSMTPAESGELTYEEERQLRELRMQKREMMSEIKDRPLTKGEGIVYGTAIGDINQQIRDIYREARSRSDN